MNRILTHIEVPSPDFCHELGQDILWPVSFVFGRSYLFTQNQSIQEREAPSLTQRIMVVALSSLFLPASLLVFAVGALLLKFSVTHKTAFEEIQDAKIKVTWIDGKPEIRGRQVLLRPIQPEDLPTYQALFTNGVAMARYAGGVRDVQSITNRFQGWLNRWKEHTFSAMAVVDPAAKKVIGHVVLGHGDYEGDLNKGWSEGALVLDPAYWNADYKEGVKGTAGKKHIGSEVVRCMIAYIDSLKARSLPVPSDVTPEQRPALEEAVRTKNLKVHRNAEGQIDWVYLPFTELRATAAKDNPSHKILEQIIKDHGGTMTPKTPERDLFVMNL